jgi:hypothetical protein
VGYNHNTSTKIPLDQFYFDLISNNKDPTVSLITNGTSKSHTKCLPMRNSAFLLEDTYLLNPLEIDIGNKSH